MRPLILVSNDDGVDAAGNIALREALSAIADVITVAPKAEQSAKSHALTLHHPLRHYRIAENVHAIDGTPADCVYVALFRKDLLPRKPDLVVSGINHGANLGCDVYYSGTVAAAREAALRGVPSIAFSMVGGVKPLEAAAECAAAITAQYLEALKSLPKGQTSLLNVNFPPAAPFAGIVSTVIGARLYDEGVAVRDDPRGREYYWIGGPGGVRHDFVEGSDTAAVDDGFVSVTPLRLDPTFDTHNVLANTIASIDPNAGAAGEETSQ